MPYLSNSVAHWLGMTPADLFLYMFLPPLLLDSAVRTDYFIFKKVRLRCRTGFDSHLGWRRMPAPFRRCFARHPSDCPT